MTEIITIIRKVFKMCTISSMKTFPPVLGNSIIHSKWKMKRGEEGRGGKGRGGEWRRKGEERRGILVYIVTLISQ